MSTTKIPPATSIDKPTPYALSPTLETGSIIPTAETETEPETKHPSPNTSTKCNLHRWFYFALCVVTIGPIIWLCIWGALSMRNSCLAEGGADCSPETLARLRHHNIAEEYCSQQESHEDWDCQWES